MTAGPSRSSSFGQRFPWRAVLVGLALDAAVAAAALSSVPSCSSGGEGAPSSGGQDGASTGGAPTGGQTGGGTATGGAPAAGGAGDKPDAGRSTGGEAEDARSDGSSAGQAGSQGGVGGTSAGGAEAGAGGARGGRGGQGTSGGAGGGCDWSDDGKMVLFDGTSLSGWQTTGSGAAAAWRLVGDGSMEVVPRNYTNIQTTKKFDDLCLHIEYMTPSYPASVTGQDRGNSGIYVRRAYEMQVLDSFGQPPQIDGCGAVYKISAPLVVACHGQLEWNTYEIEFRAAQWDASGRKTKNASFALVTLNGIVVQRNVDLAVAMTTSGEPDAPGPQALMLQDHGNPVRFRNIWYKVPGAPLSK